MHGAVLPASLDHHPSACACRQLAAAAHTLLEFAGAATRSLAQPGGSPPWLLLQVTSACGALKSCIILALCTAQLSSQTGFKLGAASSLVFGPGRIALAACAALEPLAAESHDLYNSLMLANLASRQLQSLVLLVRELLHPSSRPEAAAAFANSTAKPAALLPWLAALSIASPQIGAGFDEGESLR